MSRQAGFYFDGFNCYHAICDLHQNHLKWMSYRRLADLLVLRSEVVAYVKVFSAIANFRPPSAVRHRAFNKAQDVERVQCILGQFKQKEKRCPRCGHGWPGHEEKETDVNIALHLLADCQDGRLDVAYVVSTDSDLSPAVRMVKARGYPVELVTVSTPNRRHCFELLSVCDRKARITAPMIQASLLPKDVFAADGTLVVTRPSEYDPPAE